MIEIGPARFAHPSGALWLPHHRLLFVADPHLGYGWAQRRRGELGPLRDHLTCDKLLRVVAELSPLHLVVLGDLVHAPKPAPAERLLIEHTLTRLLQLTRLTIVAGNHDRAFTRDFRLPTVDAFHLDDLVAVHGHRPFSPPPPHLLAGHFHPAVSVRDKAGVRHRFPVFAVTSTVTLLPAFSPFAAGFDLKKTWPAELLQLLDRPSLRLFAASGSRVVELSRRRSPA